MPRSLAHACVIACLTLALPAAQAEGIDIQSVSSELVDDVYAVNADIKFTLGAEVQEALIHGVELNIDIFIEVKRKRKWLWDPGVLESVLRYKLEYQPLVYFYVITNVVNGNRWQFASIDEATAALGKIRNHVLLHRASLKRDRRYTGRLRAELDTGDLPPPLQPQAHISRQWRLESPWHEWVVR